MSFQRKINLVLAFVFVLVPPVRRACGGEPAAFQLQPEAAVDGTGIYLDQILSSNAHASLLKVRLAPAPVLGQTISLSRQQVIDLAKDSVPEMNTTNWSGPMAIKIRRRVRQLCELEVADMLRTGIAEDYVGSRGHVGDFISRVRGSRSTFPKKGFPCKSRKFPARGFNRA